MAIAMHRSFSNVIVWWFPHAVAFPVPLAATPTHDVHHAQFESPASPHASASPEPDAAAPTQLGVSV
jgi:hypothetical protein